MQLAGVPCAVYRQNILVDRDATWCARCSTVFHRHCLAKSDEICPTCHRAYDKPEGHFVFSQLCPECFRPNEPPQPQCASCAARTQWDTQDAYLAFVEHMKDTSRLHFVCGLAELGGGALCMLGLVVQLSVIYRPGFLSLGAFVLGFIALSTDGIVNLIRGRQLAKFR